MFFQAALTINAQTEPPKNLGVRDVSFDSESTLVLSVEDLFTMPAGVNIETYYDYQWTCVSFYNMGYNFQRCFTL